MLSFLGSILFLGKNEKNPQVFIGEAGQIYEPSNIEIKAWITMDLYTGKISFDSINMYDSTDTVNIVPYLMNQNPIKIPGT